MGRDLTSAVDALDAGALVVFPTDTLLGLGARATDVGAVERLLAVKGRPGGMPISVAVSSPEELEEWTRLAPAARAILRRSLPGPFTFLLPSSPRARRKLAPAIPGPSGTIGVRVPDHPVARELARRVGPITCTSANRHGRPPCRSPAAARLEFGEEVRVYLPATPSPSGKPSTLVDLTSETPRVVRRG